MIQLIVSLYRAAIGVMFVVGAFVSLMLMGNGSAGIILGFGALITLVMLTGVSAVLLSINDHLAGQRGAAPPAGAGSSLSGKQAALAVAGIIVALVVAGAFSGGVQQAEVTRNVSQPSTELGQGSSIADGCVPELASKVGLKCSD